MRTVNKAIGRGFLPLQAKAKYEEGRGNKTQFSIKKIMGETADQRVLSVSIMHADGMCIFP